MIKARNIVGSQDMEAFTVFGNATITNMNNAIHIILEDSRYEVAHPRRALVLLPDLKIAHILQYSFILNRYQLKLMLSHF